MHSIIFNTKEIAFSEPQLPFLRTWFLVKIIFYLITKTKRSKDVVLNGMWLTSWPLSNLLPFSLILQFNIIRILSVFCIFTNDLTHCINHEVEQMFKHSSFSKIRLPAWHHEFGKLYVHYFNCNLTTYFIYMHLSISQ